MRRMLASLAALPLLLAAGQAAADAVLDDLGRSLDLPAPPHRIVSLAPSNTEILFAIGVGDRLVGATAYCDFPAAARQIERVAEFNAFSLEKVVGMEPDLVVASRGNDLEGLESLRRLGIPVFSLDTQTVDGVVAAVGRLGLLCGTGEQAASVQRDLVERVAHVRAKVATVSRPRVMWGYWSEPVYTAGTGTMIDDVLTSAGGTNVGRQAPGAWPQVGLETIISWAPEVIITTYGMGEGGPDALAQEVARLQQAAGWREVPAVQQGRIYFIEPDLLNRPGPRLIDALEQVADLLHPDTRP
ncbi:MAG: cobalamin-binding protein [Candidatus Latescibacterota bacterium]